MDCASETTTDSDSDLEAGLWRPVRVLYVLDDSDRGRGTAALVRLLKRIKRHQFQAAVVSIAPHGDGTEKIQGQDFRVVSLDAPDRPGLSGLKSGLRALGGLRTLIQRYQPDVLHLMGARARIVGPLAASTRPGLPVVSSDDDGRFNRGFRRLFETLARRLGPPVLRLVPDRDHLQAPIHADLRAQDVEVVGHLLDLSAARSAAVLGFDQLDQDATWIGLHAEPGATSSLRRMLEAFRLVAAHRPDAKLVVTAARETMRPDPWESELGLEGRVVYLEPPAEPASLQRRCAVFWVHGDPVPDARPILEAMSIGVPVVCDASTGLAPGIRGIGGALMRDGRWPRQFAEATVEILENAELARALSSAGKTQVETQHPIAASVGSLRALYDRLAHEAP